MTGLEGNLLLVAPVGAAAGSRAAAAALACAGSGVDRCGLLVELGTGGVPRPTLLATGAARAVEERLAAHLPEHPAASRGRICILSLPPTTEGVDALMRALPVCRDSVGVVHLRPLLLQGVLGLPGLRPTAALLRADLDGDLSLTALATRELQERGVAVSVMKRPLGWLDARLALAGMQGRERREPLPRPLAAAAAEGRGGA